jgi:predicted lipoprotein
MRIHFATFVTILVLGLSGCVQRGPDAENTRTGEPAAHKVGREAYELAQESKEAAKVAARKLKEASHEAKEGWNEAKQEKKTTDR